MPLGFTYAIYAGAIAVGLLTQTPTTEMRARDAENGAWLFSFGKNDPSKDGIGKNGIGSIEYFSEQEWFWDLKPLWAAGGDRDGAFLSLGLRKDFYWGPFQVSPHMGPALYQANTGHFESDQLFQFRTGLDVMLPLTDNLLLDFGFYHLSNARNTDGSAGVDVTRFGLVRRF